MPTRNQSIRIRASDKQRLQQVNKRIYNKEYRLSREFGVSAPIQRKSINDFNTRQEYNNYMKRAESFLNRSNYRYVKNQYGVVVPRSEYNRLRNTYNEINRANQKRMNQITRRQFTSRGEVQPQSMSERINLMGDERYSSLRQLNFDFNRYRSEGDLRRDLERITSRRDNVSKRDKQLKANYIQGLRNVFGKSAKNIIRSVKNMSPTQFTNLFYTEDIVDFNFFYSYEEKQMKLELLNGIFE